MDPDTATTDVKRLLAKQRNFFGSGQTKDIAFRREKLEALYSILRESEGSYHGKASFDTFSHQKSILTKPQGLDIPLRYPPFKNKLKLLKKLMH